MSDEHEAAPIAPQQPKKYGRRARKGERYGGRAKGTPNRVKAEAQEKARLDAIRLAELEAAAIGKKTEVEAAGAIGKKLMKELLFEGAQMTMGLATYFQPWPEWRRENGALINANPNYDEDKFRFYLGMAREFAHAGAPFQSPRYSAMVVGATITTKVAIEGGMPDDFSPPMPGRVEIPPGTIVTADDDSGAKVIDLVPVKAAS